MLKRLLIVTVAALVAAVLAVPALADSYTWRDRTIEVEKIEKGGMFVPASMTEDEYCAIVYMTVDEELWQDEELGKALYQETVLIDPDGNAYAPEGAASGTDKPTKLFFYCIPKGIEMESLTLSFGSDPEDAGAEAGGAYAWDGATFEVTEVTEELGEYEKQLVAPEGKWVIVRLTITDGEIPIKALEERAIDNGGALLNGAPARTLIAKGVKIGDDMSAYAMGIIDLFFDVPADTDTAQAEVTINGD